MQWTRQASPPFPCKPSRYTDLCSAELLLEKSLRRPRSNEAGVVVVVVEEGGLKVTTETILH